MRQVPRLVDQRPLQVVLEHTEGVGVGHRILAGDVPPEQQGGEAKSPHSGAPRRRRAVRLPVGSASRRCATPVGATRATEAMRPGSRVASAMTWAAERPLATTAQSSRTTRATTSANSAWYSPGE